MGVEPSCPAWGPCSQPSCHCLHCLGNGDAGPAVPAHPPLQPSQCLAPSGALVQRVNQSGPQALLSPREVAPTLWACLPLCCSLQAPPVLPLAREDRGKIKVGLCLLCHPSYHTLCPKQGVSSSSLSHSVPMLPARGAHPSFSPFLLPGAHWESAHLKNCCDTEDITRRTGVEGGGDWRWGVLFERPERSPTLALPVTMLKAVELCTLVG